MRAFDFIPKLREFAKPQHLIDIHALAQWFYVENPKDYWDYEKDFVSLALPFESAWFEFAYPMKYNAGGKFITIPDVSGLPLWQAVHAIQKDVEDVPDRKIITDALGASWYANAQNQPLNRNRLVDAAMYRAINAGQEIKWITYYQPVVGDKHTSMSPGIVILHLDKYGRLVGIPQEVIDPRTGWNKDSADIIALTWPALYAISMLHCKNVDLVDGSGQQKKKKSSRGRKERTSTAVQYKVLSIKPMHGRSSGPGVAMNNLNAMHFCRGHFKDYRDGRGLFGKYNDIYWWTPQMRGNRSEGKIEKTYRIER